MRAIRCLPSREGPKCTATGNALETSSELAVCLLIWTCRLDPFLRQQFSEEPSTALPLALGRAGAHSASQGTMQVLR